MGCVARERGVSHLVLLFFLSFFALATVVLVSNAVHADIGDLCDPSGSACSAGDCQDTDGNGVGMCRDFVGTGESCNDNTIKCDSGYCDAGTCVDSFPPTPGDGQIGDYCDAGDGCAVGTCQDTDGNGVGACRDFVADGQSCDDIYVKCADGVCMSGTCVGTPSDPTCQSDYDFCMSNGKTCGTFSGTDDCASPRTVDCSLATGISCTSPNTCTNNVCVAPPTCTYPGDAVFCSSQGKTCGTFTGFNICLNTTITVDCSAALGTNCTSPYFCNENNVCALPDCVNETNAAFCSRLGKTCGIFSGTDNCGNNRQVNCTTATSTSCSSPNSCTDNVCTPEACASRDTVGGTYTSYSSYTVPGGTTSLQIKLWGAGGYGETTANSGRGGGGGYITSHFAVQPGDVIQIGISNGSRNSCSIANITRGGILVGQVVAGSGGSAGDNTGPVSAYLEPLGGGGGGYIGSSGQDGYHVSGGGGNIFPTNNSYRPTGAGADYGYPGTFLMGGLGGTTAFGDGGDGGCGWYGGGGGQAITNTAAVNAVPAERKVGGSGGGGSSYAWGGNNITIEAASGYAAANSADSDYVAGKAVGGTTGAGGAGYAVIKTGCTCPGGLCPPPACTYEGDAAFCNTRRKNCGNVVGTDTCGTQRTVDCGAATTTTCNAPDVCTDNVCRSTDDLGYNECRIEPGASCDFGDVGLFSLYTGDVSHITQYNSSLYYHMCCNINATMTPYYNNEQCPEEALFAYYTFNNSHVSQYEIPATRFRLCLHGIYGIAQCTYESNNGTCDSNEAGVASIKDDMPYKSHVAEYGVLGRNVCCSFDGSIDIEGTWIAGIEYFCGTSDGICPENLETSIGDTALCDNIYDYDCAAQAACYTPEGEKILTGQNVTLYSQSTVACSSSCDTVATVCTCTAGEFDCNTTTYSIGSCTVNSSVVAGGQCSSAANACGVTNTSGVYDACGVCSSTTPALPAGYGQSCSSPPNSCGIVSTSGTIQCDGRCSSVTPADNATLGAACQSSANACGQTTAGTMQCANYGVDNSVSCSVSAAPGFTAPHDLYGTSCAGLIGPNSCGTSWTAVQAAYGCNNVCNQTAPPPVSSNYGQACQTCNSCGQCNTGTYQCNGACSASAPAYTGAHSNYGTACSASNACGQSNAGTYSCNNVCSVTSPTYSGAHSLYGQACTSAANACGEVAAGVYGCNNVCSASTPSLPWYYDTACVSNQNNCGATSNGKRYCDYNSCEVSGSPGTPLSAPANCAYSAPSYYCGPVFPDFDYQYYTAGCQGTSCAVPAFLGACPRDTSECVGQVRYQTAGCANGVCVKNFVEDCATNAAWCAAFGGGAADGNGDLVGSWTCNAAANECSWSLIDGCNAWNCVGNDLYKQGGCSGDGNVKTPDTCSNYFQQTCPNGCSNGACIP